MLTLTDRAVEAIHNLTEQAELPAETAGLRIVARAASQDHGKEQFALSLSQGPYGGDEIVEAGTARVFLEPEAAHVLDDQKLDAAVDDGGGVKFLIAPQA